MSVSLPKSKSRARRLRSAANKRNLYEKSQVTSPQLEFPCLEHSQIDLLLEHVQYLTTVMQCWLSCTQCDNMQWMHMGFGGFSDGLPSNVLGVPAADLESQCSAASYIQRSFRQWKARQLGGAIKSNSIDECTENLAEGEELNNQLERISEILQNTMVSCPDTYWKKLYSEFLPTLAENVGSCTAMPTGDLQQSDMTVEREHKTVPMLRDSVSIVNSTTSPRLAEKFSKCVSAIQSLPEEAFAKEQHYWLARLVDEGMKYSSLALLCADGHITSRETMLLELEHEMRQELHEHEEMAGARKRRRKPKR